jgi:hypothetical protein
VTQSSFLHPCKSLAETSTTGEVGFKSGLWVLSILRSRDGRLRLFLRSSVFVPDTATSFPTFTITVNDVRSPSLLLAIIMSLLIN